MGRWVPLMGLLFLAGCRPPDCSAVADSLINDCRSIMRERDVEGRTCTPVWKHNYRNGPPDIVMCDGYSYRMEEAQGYWKPTGPMYDGHEKPIYKSCEPGCTDIDWAPQGGRRVPCEHDPNAMRPR
jgi:hypothetical protein